MAAVSSAILHTVGMETNPFRGVPCGRSNRRVRCYVLDGTEGADVMLTLGSLFDGIGGWLLAAKHAGVKPLWRAEIDDFPRGVSECHFPDVVSYTDVREINGAEVAPVDILCAGSPCQDLSLAGKRKGLAGERSGLFLDAIRIMREMQEATNGAHPRFFIWENVPGALSSNKGNDFRAVLGEITQTNIPIPKSGRWGGAGLVRSGKCEVAWRILDAQYFGVAQRRRRIFLVADFAAKERRAEEILFIEPSLQRNPTKGKRTRQGPAEGPKSRAYCAGGATVLKIRQPKQKGRGGSGAMMQDDKAYTLSTHTDQTLFDGRRTFSYQSFSQYKAEDKCANLTASGGPLGTGDSALVVER